MTPPQPTSIRDSRECKCQVHSICTPTASCFYWLCQIRRIRRSLDAVSAKTLVHAFITSHVDGCNTVLAGSPRTITDWLHRLLNAAARVVSNNGKFDRGLTHLLHSELHWLDVPQWILHKLGVTVHRCLQGRAPQYIMNCCHPSRTLPVVSDFDLPAATSSSYHNVVTAHSAIGRSPSPVRWPGTHCLTTSETRRSVPTFSGRG